MAAGLSHVVSLGCLQAQKGARGGGEVPFALSLHSCTGLAQPQALGLAMHGLTKQLRLEQTALTPDRPHPPCGFRADVLFALSPSQCPDECGSCQHPLPQPALGAELTWLMKRTRVGLGEGTGHTVGPGSGRRSPGHRPGTCSSLSPAAGQGRRWSENGCPIGFLEEMPCS